MGNFGEKSAAIPVLGSNEMAIDDAGVRRHLAPQDAETWGRCCSIAVNNKRWTDSEWDEKSMPESETHKKGNFCCRVTEKLRKMDRGGLPRSGQESASETSMGAVGLEPTKS